MLKCRAWYTIGMSLRYAQAAGLHLKQYDPSLSADRKLALSQTWWALHSVETIVTATTGRPRVVASDSCTGSPPAAAATSKDDLAASALMDPPPSLPDAGLAGNEYSRLTMHTINATESFLKHYTGIDIIMHRVLDKLYSPNTSKRSWRHTQRDITSLLTELDEWALQALPHGVLASTALPDPRQHFLLYVCYGSAKIYITRPCLCRLDLRDTGQSEESAAFNKRIAEACVQAAVDLTNKLPYPPDMRLLYERGPWWSIVHISKPAALR